MNLNKLKDLYTSSPYFIKRIYSLIPFSLRNSQKYRNWRKSLRNQTLKDRNPIDTAKYGLKNFKLYQDLYKSINIEIWNEIPFIDKTDTNKYLKDFEKHQGSKFFVTTGGVTGKPAKFYQSSNVWFKELAFVYDYFEKFGYSPRMKKASFRGGDFSSLKNNEFWINNPNYNEIHFSPFQLNNKTVGKYVNKLNEIKPKYFHGYPSIFMSLAKHMISQELKLNYKLDTIFIISEGFKKEEISFLKDFFDCNVSSFYGHSERLIFAVGDKELESYTPNPLYGYFELVDEKDQVINKNNITGEIVGTSFDNLAMPLIRYRTGDYTHYVDHTKKIFAPITGKWGQMSLIGINDEEISITALNLHSNELDEILKIQFVQIEKGKVLAYIMFMDNKKNNNLEFIENLLNGRVGNTIKFTIKVTDSFKLNTRGKSPLIINESIK
jgi:phenylacetate-CoA ligase